MLNDLMTTNNLDLLVVAIVIAATCVLGFVVYFSNRNNITNRNFLLLSLVTALWGVINFLSYKFVDPNILLWLIRSLMFFALLQAFYLYRFLIVFPEKQFIFSKIHKYFIIPTVIVTSALIFSPFVFSRIIGNPIIGEVSRVEKEWGLAVFALVAIGLVVRAFYVFIKKIKKSKNIIEKKSFRVILSGLIIMFILIIFFNFVLATVFSNPKFIPLGALFTFPFILFTSYAIFKQKLFNIKVAATAILVFSLSVTLIIEIIFSGSILQIIFRSSIFFLVLIFGINLIRSVLREVEQRVRLETLSVELEQSNSDLEVANEKLKGLDQLKSEFVSLASHQLRSPLTAIRGYTSMIIDGDYGEINNDEAKGALGKINESSINLSKIVEDLLNVTKIEQGGMKYVMTPFNLSDLAKDVVDELTIIAKNKNLEMSYVSDDDSKCMVNGDKEKLRQVIINFVDNSIKYTKNGSIKITVNREDDKIIFRIIDTGVGMNENIRETLFQKFARGDGARMNTTGTGLGLYLCKEIAEAHGGRVFVESDGPGLGSTFGMELAAI